MQHKNFMPLILALLILPFFVRCGSHDIFGYAQRSSTTLSVSGNGPQQPGFSVNEVPPTNGPGTILTPTTGPTPCEVPNCPTPTPTVTPTTPPGENTPTPTPTPTTTPVTFCGEMVVTHVGVSAARIDLNGDTIFGESDFHNEGNKTGIPTVLTHQITLLEGLNTLDVYLRGSPGDTLRVQIFSCDDKLFEHALYDRTFERETGKPPKVSDTFNSN
ncbi:MAG: hypothetical protein V1798_07200 [Pseudomonadota bacterium]